MTIKQTIYCDSYDCNLTLDVDSSDDVSSTLEYANWGENPENGWEHFCEDCLPGVLAKYDASQDE